jgi:glycosyltransferase involved in cell wall biosynthesis
MNILYFCQSFPPALYGGGEFIFFQWAKELAKRGHKVHVITQRLKGITDFEIIEGVHIHRVGPPIEYKGTLPPFLLDNLKYVISAVIKGLNIISQHKINVLHSNTYAPALAGEICGLIKKKLHIITFHDVYTLKSKDFWVRWASQQGIPGQVTITGPLVEKIIMRLPLAVFHTVSKSSMKDLLENKVPTRKIFIIANGVPVEDYSSSSSFNTHQAIYLGRLVFYKNLETVIEAWKKVTSKIPESKLLVIGDGPYRSFLEAKVKRMGLERNIVFLGRVSDRVKVKLLSESAFLVLPSVCEGFGIVVIEAFACARPVLVSRIAPLPEIVKEGVDGFTIPPFNPDKWAEKIIFLMENSDVCKRMGYYGLLKLRQKYSIEKVVDQLESLYKSLLKQ